jgi:serine/threonine-protein kinase
MLRRTTGRAIATSFAWRIIEGVASGLEHAHSNDVVHADINPSNIFITVTKDVKLLDFGVARFVNASEKEDGSSIGWVTRSYASPEVLDGEPPGFQDDIFSLGCIVYRALTGRHPFGGKTSAQARHAHLVLRPIPRLGDKYWQVLKDALSYKRSNRPESASAFFVDKADSEKMESVLQKAKRYRVPLFLLASVALIASSWWVFQTDADDTVPAEIEPVAVEGMVAGDAEPVAEPSALDVALDNAAIAMESSRLLAPVDDNARDYYREALELDPMNSIALAGLREISNDYVQQAESALRSGEVESAVAALSIADVTDPGNPALATVNELFTAQANEALANARFAVSQGDIVRANEQLSLAERYSRIDAASIDEIRSSFLQFEKEGELLAAIASANASITDGRLIEPAADNAHEQLLQLQRVYGSEPRVVASIERLVERLLNRAAFATAAGQFPVATEFIDAAAMFGVLEPDIASNRQWLQQAIDLAAASVPVETALPMPVETETDGLVDTGPQPADESAVEDSAASDEVAGQDSNPVAATDTRQLMSFSELDIEIYVAPVFPARASESETSGIVDLHFNVNPDGSTSSIEIVSAVPPGTFDPSATDAVRQWRFAERDEVVRAKVRLRFVPQSAQ